VAVGDADLIHAVAAEELLVAGVVADPRDPVMADLEGRCIRKVEAADFEPRLLRDALAKLGGHVPAAAPALEELGDGIIMAIVIEPCEVDAIAGPLEDDGIGTQDRLFLGDLAQRLAQLGGQLQGLLANDEVRGSAG
jgi:hypothetical protein